MSVKIVVDDAALKDVQKRLGTLAHKAPNAIANSLNRSVSNINANIPKEVRKDYHMKAGDIKKSLNSVRASPKKLAAQVTSKGKLVGLDKFKVSPKTVNPKRKSQLKIAVKKDGMKQIMGAFVANIHGTKIFKREGEKRLPVGRLMGPSIPQMIGNEETVKRIEHQSWVTYEKNLNHYINFLLSKL